MPSISTVWVVSTLAMYQTRFWVEVAQHLQSYGQSMAFLSFDDRSTEYITKKKFPVYSASNRDKQKAEFLMNDQDASLAHYGIENLNFWLTHERFAFDLYDSRKMTLRLLTYLAFTERSLLELSRGDQPVMIQELGGFISVIAGFFASRRLGIDNWFIEPSFFRGRQFFLKNRFSAIEVPQRPVVSVRDEVRAYLNEVQEKKIIVMPLKDKRHYSAALKKIFNLHNASRLVEKSVDKYILGKHQEFGHLRSHVLRHSNMLSNSVKLKGSYTKLSELEQFVYYPLHVPGDMALTIRSPQFLDQLGLVDYLVRNLPNGYRLAIKEHPAMVGAVDANRLKKLLRRYDQLNLINPIENNFDVIQRSSAVVSINSKSGAEAMLLGKPVLVLGDAFYRNSALVSAVESINEIGARLKESLSNPHKLDRLGLEQYFEQLWRCSYPGELYVVGDDNTRVFAHSMKSSLMQSYTGKQWELC